MGLCSVIQFKPKEVELDDPKRIANLVRNCSKKYELDPKILAALIYQESKGDIWAQRYETGFYKKFIEGKGRAQLSGYVPPDFPTLLTEKVSRAYSWGLVQMLGATFRWQGFTGDYMAEACDPRINIEFGAKYLRYCLEKSFEAGAGIVQYKAALALYNGIRDHHASNYDEKVLAHVENGNYQKILLP